MQDYSAHCGKQKTHPVWDFLYFVKQGIKNTMHRCKLNQNHSRRLLASVSKKLKLKNVSKSCDVFLERIFGENMHTYPLCTWVRVFWRISHPWFLCVRHIHKGMDEYDCTHKRTHLTEGIRQQQKQPKCWLAPTQLAICWKESNENLSYILCSMDRVGKWLRSLTLSLFQLHLPGSPRLSYISSQAKRRWAARYCFHILGLCWFKSQATATAGRLADDRKIRFRSKHENNHKLGCKQ